MNYFENLDKSLCCGCTACASVCPTKNIEMKADLDGFCYPEKIEDCTTCGLCVKVCPITNSESLKNPANEKCFAITSPDLSVLKASASGGAFTIILDGYLKDETDFAVFGAEMTNDLKVMHSYATTHQDIAKFKKSKYVKSEIGESYIDAKRFLDSGKKVVFSGTPCQIAGLKAFLRKDYDNLLTIDLICHGVPSQMHFDKYIQFLERRFKSKVISYQFRSKKKILFNEDPLSVKIQFENKAVEIPHYSDYFMKSFLLNAMLMSSCLSCKFADIKRPSDMTIADFWGIEGYSKKYDNNKLKKSASLVIVNTEKGENVWNNCEKSTCFETTAKNASKENGCLSRPSKPHPKREEFMNCVREENFDSAVDKILGKPKKINIKKFLVNVSPRFVKQFAKKILRK